MPRDAWTKSLIKIYYPIFEFPSFLIFSGNFSHQNFSVFQKFGQLISQWQLINRPHLVEVQLVQIEMKLTLVLAGTSRRYHQFSIANKELTKGHENWKCHFQTSKFNNPKTEELRRLIAANSIRKKWKSEWFTFAIRLRFWIEIFSPLHNWLRKCIPPLEVLIFWITFTKRQSVLERSKTPSNLLTKKS